MWNEKYKIRLYRNPKAVGWLGWIDSVETGDAVVFIDHNWVIHWQNK